MGKSKVKCKICGESFTNKDYQKHIDNCRMQNILYEHEENKQVHELGEKIIRGLASEEEKNTYKNLTEKESFNFEEGTKEFLCLFCDKSCKSIEALDSHISIKHKDKWQEYLEDEKVKKRISNKKLDRCQHCGLFVKSLEEHSKKCKSLYDSKVLDNIEKYEEDKQEKFINTKEIILKIPQLKPSYRAREYESYSIEDRAKVLESFLFKGITKHRELDKKILMLDSEHTKGFESMNILHYLGLKKEFKNLFSEYTIDEAINMLKSDNQDFQVIVYHLEVLSDEVKNGVELTSNTNATISTPKSQQNNQEPSSEKESSEPESSSESIESNLLEAINKHQKEIEEIEIYLNPNIVHDIDKYIEEVQQEYVKNLQSTPPEKKKYIVTRSVKVGRNETKWFLEKQYRGLCQVCGFTFTKRKEGGGQYFELFDWFSEKITKQKVPIVLAGSSLSLCSRCHSGVKYGSFETKLVENLEGLDVSSLSFDEFVEKISESVDGKDIPECYEFVEMDMYKVPIKLFGEEEFIFYTEEHFLQLYTMMRSRK